MIIVVLEINLGENMNNFREEINNLVEQHYFSYAELDLNGKMALIKAYLLDLEFIYRDTVDILVFADYSKELFNKRNGYDPNHDFTWDSTRQINVQFIDFICRTYINPIFVFKQHFLIRVEYYAEAIFEQFNHELMQNNITHRIKVG